MGRLPGGKCREGAEFRRRFSDIILIILILIFVLIIIIFTINTFITIENLKFNYQTPGVLQLKRLYIIYAMGYKMDYGMEYGWNSGIGLDWPVRLNFMHHHRSIP